MITEEKQVKSVAFKKVTATRSFFPKGQDSEACRSTAVLYGTLCKPHTLFDSSYWTSWTIFSSTLHYANPLLRKEEAADK